MIKRVPNPIPMENINRIHKELQKNIKKLQQLNKKKELARK